MIFRQWGKGNGAIFPISFTNFCVATWDDGSSAHAAFYGSKVTLTGISGGNIGYIVVGK